MNLVEHAAIPNIAANISALAAQLMKLRAHPMCVTLTDDGERFLMTVPPGFSIDVIRVNYTIMGKTRALEVMERAAEKYWRL